MANPPVARPWSRLASLRVPAPESHPQNTSSLDNINASVTKSPPSVQSPMQSQKLKLITPPPSPLTLPPPSKKMMEEEPKTVLVNKTIEKTNVNSNAGLHKESNETQKQEGIDHHEKQVTTKENEMKWKKGIHKKVLDSEDSGIRVLTIAGENKGAYMQIIHSRKKPNYLHNMGNSKMKKAYDYESENSANTEEGKANRKEKSLKLRTLSSPPKTSSVYINSNVQCVNNSLLFNTSCTYHDPGVHLTLSKKPLGEGFHLKEHFDEV